MRMWIHTSSKLFSLEIHTLLENRNRLYYWLTDLPMYYIFIVKIVKLSHARLSEYCNYNSSIFCTQYAVMLFEKLLY